jgi:glycosyltransferase involved in cell wall biosynthesis
VTAGRNISIISAVYPPEPQVSARMSWDLAKYLTAQGCCVTVLCPQPSRPLNTDYSQYSNPDAPVVKYEESIKVVRLPSFAAPESSILARMRESISFGREVSRYLVREQNMPDVLYVNAWPLFAQAIIARFAKKAAVPMVLQIMDIYPESFTGKLPALLRSVISLPLMWLDARIAGTAVKVSVISENMRRTYMERRGVSAESVVTIPTWQDENAFENVTARSVCCQRYGISNLLFTFLFLGNIGTVAGVDFLIRAFAEADIPDTQLVIAGGGASKSDCVKMVKQLNLSHVHFISDPDVANVPVLQSMAHVCMLPMKRGAGMSSIPSKLPSYLFSAKPVIATVDRDSDTARFVREAECGLVGDAEDQAWLVYAMKEVAQMSLEELDAIGQRSKKFGLAHFSKSSGVVRLANTIMQVAGVKE